jgi:hypothetical protein
MHLEVLISVASAAVTVVAAGVAGWQAREARRQAKAAEDQVREARRSAVAAEDQVEIMRRQHGAYQAERDERDAERRDREKEQAALVTIEVSDSPSVVTITNHSEQQVRQLYIESINGPQPEVRWGGQVLLESDMNGEVCAVSDWYGYSEKRVLRPHTSTNVEYQYFDAHNYQTVSPNFFTESVRVDHVTIMFDMSGVRWRLTGNEEPVRVVE